MDQKNLIKFLVLWVANTLLLVIFSAVFRNDIVLGNISTSKPLASLIVGFLLSILIYFVPQAAKKMELKLKDEKITALVYFAVNAVALWVIKRLADFTALGISSVLFVAILAAAAAVVQTGVEKYTVKFLKKA